MSPQKLIGQVAKANWLQTTSLHAMLEAYSLSLLWSYPFIWHTQVSGPLCSLFVLHSCGKGSDLLLVVPICFGYVATYIHPKELQSRQGNISWGPMLALWAIWLALPEFRLGDNTNVQQPDPFLRAGGTGQARLHMLWVWIEHLSPLEQRLKVKGGCK